MSMNGVISTKQAESIVEVEEDVAVSSADNATRVIGGVFDDVPVLVEESGLFGVFDEFSSVDVLSKHSEVFSPFFFSRHSSTFIRGDFNLRFESWRRRLPKRSLPAAFSRQTTEATTRTSKEVVA